MLKFDVDPKSDPAVMALMRKIGAPDDDIGRHDVLIAWEPDSDEFWEHWEAAWFLLRARGNGSLYEMCSITRIPGRGHNWNPVWVPALYLKSDEFDSALYWRIGKVHEFLTIRKYIREKL